MRSLLVVVAMIALGLMSPAALAQTPTATPTPDPCPSAACLDCFDFCPCARAKPGACNGFCASGAPCVDTGNGCTCLEPTATPTPHLNHFQCYELHSGQTNTVSGISLADSLGASTVDALRAKRICNPADKNDEDPDAPSDPLHLVSYELRQTSPPFVPVLGQVVINQFGTFRVDLLRPDHLMVPTAKSLVAPPTAPIDPSLHHFKCYKVRSETFRAFRIKVDDQFGSITVDIKRPLHLCAPADKNAEDPMAPSDPAHLMCYRIRLSAGTPDEQLPAGILTNNQFGPRDFVPFGTRELCVPSTKLDLVAVAPPDGLDFVRWELTNLMKPPPMVSLLDQFVPGTPSPGATPGPPDDVTLDQGTNHFLMNPVTRKKLAPSGPEEKTKDPKRHMTCYTIKDAKPVEHELLVLNQFRRKETQKLKVKGKATLLCLPSVKNDGNLPIPALNHFKCYPVVRGDAINKDYTIDDQFLVAKPMQNDFQPFKVGRPTLFCNSTAKTLNGQQTPTEKDDIQHLTCYDVLTKRGGRIAGAAPPQIRNQFVPNGTGAVVRVLRDVCVATNKVKDVKLGP